MMLGFVYMIVRLVSRTSVLFRQSPHSYLVPHLWLVAAHALVLYIAEDQFPNPDPNASLFVSCGRESKTEATRNRNALHCSQNVIVSLFL